ncbi:hypothetical protein GYMLUDRAFT_181297, partial [Collybiopsis luxurians FD-317 M1]
NVLQICQISKVTLCSIAYAAIHLHFALTNTSQWAAISDSYNYQDLWNYIVDFFEVPVDMDQEDNAKALLKWWNGYVFWFSYSN